MKFQLEAIAIDAGGRVLSTVHNSTNRNRSIFTEERAPSYLRAMRATVAAPSFTEERAPTFLRRRSGAGGGGAAHAPAAPLRARGVAFEHQCARFSSRIVLYVTGHCASARPWALAIRDIGR